MKIRFNDSRILTASFDELEVGTVVCRRDGEVYLFVASDEDDSFYFVNLKEGTIEPAGGHEQFIVCDATMEVSFITED